MRTTRRRHDMRVALRVTAIDLKSWHVNATDRRLTLSAMIRDAVSWYLNDPPGGTDLSELKFTELAWFTETGKARIDRAEFRKMTRCDETIVLRVPRAEHQRWRIAARHEGRSVSAMVRRAVRRYIDDLST